MRDDIAVAPMVADMAADMDVHMVADMEMDKVADKVAYMFTDTKFGTPLLLAILGTPIFW